MLKRKGIDAIKYYTIEKRKINRIQDKDKDDRMHVCLSEAVPVVKQRSNILDVLVM